MDNKFKFKSEIADRIGIPRKTFASYYTGHRSIATPDNRKKLFKLTGIESFKSEKPNSQEAILLRTWVDSVIDKSKKETPQGDKTFSDSSSRPFLDTASELRNWFANQHQWNSKKEFADFLGISRTLMKKIFLGVKEPKDDAKQKLYDITKLACFKDVTDVGTENPQKNGDIIRNRIQENLAQINIKYKNKNFKKGMYAKYSDPKRQISISME